jgi:hypothetical protein
VLTLVPSAGGTTINGRDTKRVVIPVTVLGTQDGKWDRNAWKTDAFFGNPLAGFTPPQ